MCIIIRFRALSCIIVHYRTQRLEVTEKREEEEDEVKLTNRDAEERTKDRKGNSKKNCN